MKKEYTQRGITLIALIITIVILLILAVVTINAIKNGDIIAKSKEAADKYEEKRKEEGSILDSYLSLIDERDLIKHEGIIPEGGVYTCADGTVYNAGQNFPEIVASGDTYEYGDYKYTLIYKEDFEQFETVEDARNAIKEEFEESLKEDETSPVKTWEEWIASDQCPYSTEEEIWKIIGLTEEMFYGYWNVEVKQTNKTQYGEILEKINDRYITSVDSTFENCNALTVAPKIPSNVTSMQETFWLCDSLITAPTIPDGVENMGGTFYGCTALTTAPIIPSSVNIMVSTDFNWYNDSKWGDGWTHYGCFEGCSSLKGSIEVNTERLTEAGRVDSEKPVGCCYKCFYGTEKEITLTGSASDTVKELLASTGNNGNVTY